jgi:hypothetical protein
MDARRFDTLARIVSTAGSRRRVVESALGGVLALRGLAEPDEAEAKKKCPPCKKRKNGKCKKRKPDGTGCPGGTCQGGSCVAGNGGNGCPDRQKLCGTACILAGQCCTDSDCPTGTTCCDQLCTDTMTDPRHCGGCTTACLAGKTCGGGLCCTAREDDCTTAGECCGTDVCSTGLPDNRCMACVSKGAGCEHAACCPGLFCVFLNASGTTCVACMPKGESCQNVACCDGLFCQSGKCEEPGTG